MSSASIPSAHAWAQARPAKLRGVLRCCAAWAWSGVRTLGPFLGLMLMAALLTAPAHADTLTLDFSGGEGAFASRLAQILMLVTAISLAPAVVVAGTAFVRIVVTLSILRAALGLQQTPPNMVLVSLALFLTAFVMAPTLERSWREGVQPLMAQEIDPEDGFSAAAAPLKDFMNAQVDARHLAAFERLLAQRDRAEADPDATGASDGDLTATGGFEAETSAAETSAAEAPAGAPAGADDDPPLQALAPAFIVSELSRAFEIGFLIFLPFLVIDLVVAAVLMSMGMMMLPPAVVSLPFKLIFFVLIDGWRLVSEGLALSFVPP